MHVQVEGRSQVRDLLPTPQEGDLPLPGGGLPKVSFSFQPASVEDLNQVVPEGQPKLSTQHASQVTLPLPLWSILNLPAPSADILML